MRNRHLGGLKKLPKNINDIKLDGIWSSDFHLLENDISNTQYRVIYCIAKLKKKYNK